MWSDEVIPSPHEYIDRTFGLGGYLANRWGETYQPREGQILLARAVDHVLCERTHLLSEAPCGVGKSIGYSVPATYHAAMHGKVVVIVTANIALQEQLVQKDLPLLAEILPWAFSFGLMKGRGNYLCRSSYEEVRLSGRQETMFESGTAAERDKVRLMQWAEKEVADRLRGVGGYGDVSSLNWKPADKLWRELSVSPEDCLGKRCEFAETCGARAAQKLARDSQVVVTNYHLFFLNLLMCMDRGAGILPPFDAVIFDEAHQAANIARDFFGWKIGEGSIRRAVRYFRNRDPQFAESVQQAGMVFFDQMMRLKWDRDRYRARIVPSKLNQAEVGATEALLDKLLNLAGRLYGEMRAIGAGGGGAAQQAKVEVEFNRVQKLCNYVAGLKGDDDDNVVYFIEEDEFRKAHVAARLVKPAQVLYEALFENTVVHGDEDGVQSDPQRVSVVCTSATLATESGFEFAAGELGAHGYESLTVESPFDFESQALLIIPEMYDPNDVRFTSEVAAAMLRTIVLARGRTLGLFTSRKRMNEVFDAVNGRTPFRILKQDDGQRTQLIEEFKRDTHACLFGVASFWAGVDVPGESLSCVFIDKIPFPTPDDPVLDRLSETDKRAWNGYAVPRAVIEFKQGFGRLIRSTTDRGVVVCCDTRLITKGYGKQFLKSMPKGMQKIRNLEAIREWLDGPQAAEEAVDPLS